MKTEDVSALLKRLFPICRSLTGEGNRKTLSILSEIVSLNVHEVPCGTTVYDWEVPPEWNISEAYIETGSGDRIADFEEHNLHVVNYSVPVDRTVSYEELKEHVHTLPDKPGAIPYRTSYYERNWGFCLRHETFEQLDEEETYHVYIDSELDPEGSLTYADAKIDGPSDKEYLLSTYCCHPSLANDNLSGLVLAPLLFDRIRSISPYHSYRLVIVPETIGAITYLNEHEQEMKQIDGGYVVTTVAGPGAYDYKESFEGDHAVDKAAQWALESVEYDRHEFVPQGSDERQYSTPGFQIPTATIAKNKYYEYEAYHTSDDDLSFVSAEALTQTLDRYWEAIRLLEMNRVYERSQPHGEFKLDQYDLHPTTGGQQRQQALLAADQHEDFEYEVEGTAATTGEFLDGISWLMFGCDGDTSLFELAERSGLSVETLFGGAQELSDVGLLVEVSG